MAGGAIKRAPAHRPHFGLPGETLQSFAQGFDCLYALRPQEIQLGILKRLRGTPITRHWDLVANSGRFGRTLVVLLVAALVQNPSSLSQHSEPPMHSAFDAFIVFTDWLWATTQQTSGLTPEVLVDALFGSTLTRMTC